MSLVSATKHFVDFGHRQPRLDFVQDALREGCRALIQNRLADRQSFEIRVQECIENMV